MATVCRDNIRLSSRGCGVMYVASPPNVEQLAARYIAGTRKDVPPQLLQAGIYTRSSGGAPCFFCTFN